MGEETPAWSRTKEEQLPGLWDSISIGDLLMHPECDCSPSSKPDHRKMRGISSLRADVARLELERDALKLQVLAMEDCATDHSR